MRNSIKFVTSPIIINSSLSNILNFLRWFAAFLVLIEHTRSIFFIPWYEVENKNIYIKIFYFITGFGHYGVLIFFTLSGFLIMNSIYAKNYNYKQYCIDRFSRIYIVLIPALFIVFILDTVGIDYYNSTGIYNASYPMGALSVNAEKNLSMLTFLGNIFMTQNIFVNTLGTNSPLWSLNWEWWSYAIAPILTYLLINKKYYTSLIIFFLMFFFLNYMFLWFIGGLIIFIKHKNKFLIFLALVVLLLIPTLIRGQYLSNIFLLDCLFILGIVIIISYERTIKLHFFKKINKFFADFSFSQYILHMPIFVFLMAILQSNYMQTNQFEPNFFNFLIYILLIIISMIFIYIFSLFTEKNTNRLKVYLKNKGKF